MMKTHRIVREGTVALHPSDIPDEVYDLMCVALNRSVRLALSDPAKRAEYEAWKAEQALKRGEICG